MTVPAGPKINNYEHLYIKVQGKINAVPVVVAGPSGFEPQPLTGFSENCPTSKNPGRLSKTLLDAFIDRHIRLHEGASP